MIYQLFRHKPKVYFDDSKLRRNWGKTHQFWNTVYRVLSKYFRVFLFWKIRKLPLWPQLFFPLWAGLFYGGLTASSPGDVKEEEEKRGQKSLESVPWKKSCLRKWFTDTKSLPSNNTKKSWEFWKKNLFRGLKIQKLVKNQRFSLLS